MREDLNRARLKTASSDEIQRRVELAHQPLGAECLSASRALSLLHFPLALPTLSPVSATTGSRPNAASRHSRLSGASGAESQSLSSCSSASWTRISSTHHPPQRPTPDADTDADADVAPGEPSQKGELCVCIGDGVPNSCTVTVDVIVFKLALGKAILRAGAEDATAPWMFTSRARFCLLARCLRGECALPPARLRGPRRGSPSRVPHRARRARQSI